MFTKLVIVGLAFAAQGEATAHFESENVIHGQRKITRGSRLSPGQDPQREKTKNAYVIILH